MQPRQRRKRLIAGELKTIDMDPRLRGDDEQNRIRLAPEDDQAFLLPFAGLAGVTSA